MDDPLIVMDEADARWLKHVAPVLEEMIDRFDTTTGPRFRDQKSDADDEFNVRALTIREYVDAWSRSSRLNRLAEKLESNSESMAAEDENLKIAADLREQAKTLEQHAKELEGPAMKELLVLRGLRRLRS